MRRRKIWLSIIIVLIIVVCSACVGAALKPDNTNELVVAVVSLAVALLALYISLRTFYSIDEVNAISRMDGNVMENPRYRPNILKAVFLFRQVGFTETSQALMSHMESLFHEKNKQSGAHIADNVQEVADMMVLVPFFIHTNDKEATYIHINNVRELLRTMKSQVANFKEISDGSCKLLDETVKLIDSIFAYQNMSSTDESGPSKLLEIRGSIFINPVSCILYNNYLGLYFLRRARSVLGRQQGVLTPKKLIESTKECSVEEKSIALVYCIKAFDSFKRAKEYIGDDMIWNGFVCFNLTRAEYLKQLLNESLGDKNVGNDWEMYINESIRSWITSNMIIAEHFASKLEKEQVTWLQQALISQENKVRLTKIILQIMKNSSLTDYNGNVWLKSYSKLLKTPFFKGIPEKDPQQLTDSLVKDIEELLESE